MNLTQPGLAALGMYDIVEIRGAAQELWDAIASRLEGAPRELVWDGDLASQWLAPNLVVGQTCGWPLVTSLAGRVTVVGTFRHAGIGEAGGPLYRSVLVAREERPLASFAGGVGAINGWDSLSGWVSLAHGVAPHSTERPFFGRVVCTGAHGASIEAVLSGEADLAAIDAVTLALLRRHRPDAVAGLRTVGRGPLIPTLPVVTADADPAPARAAIVAAVRDPATARARAELLVEGFSEVDASAYADVEALGPVAHEVIPPPTG